jgi:hypothetical protein
VLLLEPFVLFLFLGFFYKESNLIGKCRETQQTTQKVYKRDS